MLKSVEEQGISIRQACPLKRAKYLSKINDYIAQGFASVYMDESGFESETLRPFGYATIGTPCLYRYNWQGEKRTNVISDLYKKALFALNYFEKNINVDIFIASARSRSFRASKPNASLYGYRQLSQTRIKIA